MFVLALRGEGERPIHRDGGVCVIGIRRGRVRGDSMGTYLLAYFSFFLAALAWTTRLHLRRRIDAVHANNMPNFLVFAALVPRLAGAGVLLDIHDSMAELFATKFGRRMGDMVGSCLRLEERSSARFATRVTCVNGPHRDLTASHGVPLEKIEVVMNLPDERIFGQPLPEPAVESPFVLVYHGLLSKRLGVDVVLGALAELEATPSRYRYRVIGHGDAAPELRRTTNELGLDDVVEFHGPVPPSELPALLDGAHLAVLALRRDPCTEVMLPTKLLEYLALGIPVAAVETRCLRAYFDDETLMYLKGPSVPEVVRAIEALRGDPERRRAMRARGMAFAGEHRWQDEARRYVGLVETIGRRSVGRPAALRTSRPVPTGTE